MTSVGDAPAVQNGREIEMLDRVLVAHRRSEHDPVGVNDEGSGDHNEEDDEAEEKAHGRRYPRAMFALVVRFDLRDTEAASAFDQLVADTVKAIIEHEPGTLLYATHTVDGEPLARIFYDVYRDREAFEEHERQPHTRRFLTERDNFVRGARVEFLSPAAAKGLPAD
ncbi:putative quinol monooxygenase [Nocardia sp. CA-151230]|uniref:putative quinol monooxygenase n=1 Tax=Nocardia sp. CA-151230 TaxID=3239982 RepID=UPI003D8E01AB